jgi:hypothetical protein
MTKSSAERMIAKLLANVAELRFGYASVTVKVHEKRVVEVSYSTTDNSKEREPREKEPPKD